jgi:hypothetical protein
MSDAAKEESLCNFDHLQKVMKAFWYTVFVSSCLIHERPDKTQAENSPTSVESPTEFHIPTLKTAEKRIKHKHLIKISYIYI